MVVAEGEVRGYMFWESGDRGGGGEDEGLGGFERGDGGEDDVDKGGHCCCGRW